MILDSKFVFVKAILAIVMITVPVAQANADEPVAKKVQWFKGNLHTHSLWSDGNDFPEMIVKWYHDRGYHFLSLTDHNILSEGEKWMEEKKIVARGGKTVLEKYFAVHGDDSLVTKIVNEKTLVRLKGLNEFRKEFESPEKFLLIAGEEISDRSENAPVHMNAINLANLLEPVGGPTVKETLVNNLRAVNEQAKKIGQPIILQVNHPNFGWAVTAEDLVAAKTGRFMEVYNGHPAINHLGDKDHPGIERLWDIVNTIRIGELAEPPILGTATDDSHNYHGVKKSQPGRGWVMVKSKTLDANSLLEAMNQGEFYCSSGVTLPTVEFDGNKLSLTIEPEEGVTFETKFVGTRKDYDRSSKPRLNSEGKPFRATRIYSKDIGVVLKTDSSLTPSYELTGEELYVRAVVTSSKDHPNPSFKNQKIQAWTQPVR